RLGPLGAGLGGAIMRIAVATALMLVAAVAVDATLAGWLPPRPLFHHGLRVAVVLPVAVVAFWAGGRALGIAVPTLRRPRRAWCAGRADAGRAARGRSRRATRRGQGHRAPPGGAAPGPACRRAAPARRTGVARRACGPRAPRSRATSC